MSSRCQQSIFNFLEEIIPKQAINSVVKENYLLISEILLWCYIGINIYTGWAGCFD